VNDDASLRAYRPGGAAGMTAIPPIVAHLFTIYAVIIRYVFFAPYGGEMHFGVLSRCAPV
jgi:hypothetical protein